MCWHHRYDGQTAMSHTVTKCEQEKLVLLFKSTTFWTLQWPFKWLAPGILFMCADFFLLQSLLPPETSVSTAESWTQNISSGKPLAVSEEEKYKKLVKRHPQKQTKAWQAFTIPKQLYFIKKRRRKKPEKSLPAWGLPPVPLSDTADNWTNYKCGRSQSNGVGPTLGVVQGKRLGSHHCPLVPDTLLRHASPYVNHDLGPFGHVGGCLHRRGKQGRVESFRS